MKIEEVISDANLYNQNRLVYSTEKQCGDALIDLPLSPQSDIKIQEPTIHQIEGVYMLILKLSVVEAPLLRRGNHCGVKEYRRTSESIT